MYTSYPTTRPSRETSWAPLAITVASLGALELATWLGGQLAQPRYSIAAATAWLLAAVLPPLLARVTRAPDARERALGVFMAAPIALALGVGSSICLAVARVDACAAPASGLLLLLLACAFLPAWLTTYSAQLVVAALARRSVAALDVGVRRAALGSAAVAGLLVALACARTARYPDPDAYVQSLPVIVTLPSARELGGCDYLASTDSRTCGRSADGASFQVRCSGARCYAGVLRPDAPSASGFVEYGLSGISPDAHVEVRRDDAHGLWWLVALEPHGPSSTGRAPMHAEDASRPQPSPHVVSLAHHLAPPVGWTVGALGVFAYALAELLVARRGRSLLDAIAQSRPGLHDGAGLVEFQDGDPVHVGERAARLSRGPVVVFAPAAVVPRGYRDSVPSIDAGLVAPGTRDELADALRCRLIAAHARATTALALGCAPLAAAAFARLLG